MAQAAEIFKRRVPEDAVNAQCWTRKESLNL